jgi:DNA polymerase-1
MPIQGTNADIMKIAMLKIWNFLETQNIKSQLIMQVHDEVVFDIFPWEENIMEKEIKKLMENILKDKSIRLKVDCEIWLNWKELK